MLRLTEDCPKASTSTHIFRRNPDITTSFDLISLPLLAQSANWLGEVARELDLREAMESMKRTLPSIESVPLVEFRERIDQLPYSKYRRIEGYLLTFVLYLVLLCTLAIATKFIIRIIRKCNTCYFSSRDPNTSEPTAPTTRANSDVTDSSLPSYVRKNVLLLH